MFTCCVSTQTLERVICFDTYKAPLSRAASDEAGCWTTMLRWFCLSVQGRFTQGVWRSSAGTLSPTTFLQAAGSSRLQVCSSPSLTLGPIAPCWAKSLPLGRGKVTEGAVTPESLPVSRKKIQPLLQTRVSASEIGGIFFSLWEGSCSWLLASAESSRNPAPVAKTSPSYLNPMASTRLHKRKLEYLPEKSWSKITITFSSDNRIKNPFSLTFWEWGTQMENCVFPQWKIAGMPEEDHIDVTGRISSARSHPLQKEKPASLQNGFNI